MPSVRVPTVGDLDGIKLRGLGLLAETFDATALAGSLTMVSGTVYFGLVALRPGQTITNIVTQQQTAGATLTLVRLGVYSKAGVKLAETGDVKAAFLSTGNPVSALSTPFVVGAEDSYYLAIIATGTTPPVLREGLEESDMFGAIGTGVRRFAIQAAQTDLPASATFANSQFSPWLAAS